MDQEKICINCGECYDERGHELPRYYCTIDGHEVSPHDSCGGAFFREKREYKEDQSE